MPFASGDRSFSKVIEAAWDLKRRSFAMGHWPLSPADAQGMAEAKLLSGETVVVYVDHICLAAMNTLAQERGATLGLVVLVTLLLAEREAWGGGPALALALTETTPEVVVGPPMESIPAPVGSPNEAGGPSLRSSGATVDAQPRRVRAAASSAQPASQDLASEPRASHARSPLPQQAGAQRESSPASKSHPPWASPPPRRDAGGDVHVAPPEEERAMLEARTPLHEFQEKVEVWLQSQNDTQQEERLLDWLQGRELIALGNDEEPAVWILRVMERIDIQSGSLFARRGLAGCCARILDRQLDVNQGLFEKPKQLFGNLLWLCAGAGWPMTLCEPLTEITARRKLRGQWTAGDLRRTLVLALLRNQSDRRFEDVWQTFLDGRQDLFLRGTVYDGFMGVVLMPKERGMFGTPDLDAVCGATTQILFHIIQVNRKSAPVREFASALRAVGENCNVARASWLDKLTMEATRAAWPPWAQATLAAEMGEPLT